MNSRTKSEIRQCLDRLAAGSEQERNAATVELGRLGVITRGTVRPRGSLAAAAVNRLPAPERIEQLVRLLPAEDNELRCRLALALGEWAGDEAVKVLARVARHDADEMVRLYCIAALRTIGGPEAVRALGGCADPDNDLLCNAAVDALEELATGGAADMTESPVHKPGPAPRMKTSPAPIRTRSGSRSGNSDLAASMASATRALRRVGTRAVSSRLQSRASEVLALLESQI